MLNPHCLLCLVQLLQGFWHLWQAFFHLLQGFCHIWQGFCHLWQGFCHLWQGFFHLLQGFCHLLQGFCHLWQGFCHLWQGFFRPWQGFCPLSSPLSGGYCHLWPYFCRLLLKCFLIWPGFCSLWKMQSGELSSWRVVRLKEPEKFSDWRNVLLKKCPPGGLSAGEMSTNPTCMAKVAKCKVLKKLMWLGWYSQLVSLFSVGLPNVPWSYMAAGIEIAWYQYAKKCVITFDRTVQYRQHRGILLSPQFPANYLCFCSLPVSANSRRLASPPNN